MPPIRLPAHAAALLTLGIALPLIASAQVIYVPAYAFTTYAGASHTGNRDGTGPAARFDEPLGVATDVAGNVYVADCGNHTIRKISPAGEVTTFAGTAGSGLTIDHTGVNARFVSPRCIAVDASGVIYVGQSWILRKITPDGQVTTLAGTAQMGSADGFGSSARFGLINGLATDAGGFIYVADMFNHTIRKVSPTGQVMTLAGLAGVSGSSDGTGSSARFNYPQGVAVDAGGTIYVSDRNNHTIRKITPAGIVTTLAGSPGVSGHNDGSASTARFANPQGLSVDPSGNLLVADVSNQVVRRVTPAGEVTTYAGTLYNVGSRDGHGTSARFYNLNDVATDRTGNLFVADTSNNAIRRISPTREVSTFAGLGIDSVRGTTDGDVRSARFLEPTGITIGPGGDLYLSDAASHTIRKITPTGIVSTIAGIPHLLGSADGPVGNASFSTVQGLAVDPSENIYVADSLNHTIRRISSDGVVSTVAGLAGSAGIADGPGSTARFNRPRGLVRSPTGDLFVADSENGAIRRISPEGLVTTLAGVAGSRGSVDGHGPSARFAFPLALTLDQNLNLLVADQQAIRKVTQSGTVSTYAGVLTPPGSSSGETLYDGSLTIARFGQIHGLAVDSGGYVYVTDWGSNSVRRITPDGIVTTLAGFRGLYGNIDGLGRTASFESPMGVTVDAAGQVYVTSGYAILKGVAPKGPVIITQPQNQIVTTGHQVQFSVTATGAPEPTYQWFFNGQPYLGATASTLSFSSARSSDAGDYTVAITNALGSVTSTKATLTVAAAVLPPATGGSSAAGSSGGGGGGGAPSVWFVSVLLILGWVRCLRPANCH